MIHHGNKFTMLAGKLLKIIWLISLRITRRSIIQLRCTYKLIIVIKMKTKRILPLSDNGFDMAHGFPAFSIVRELTTLCSENSRTIFLYQRNLLFIKIAA